MIMAMWEWLAANFGLPPLFTYITFRAAIGAVFGFVLVAWLGGWFASTMQQLQFGQQIREDGPAHQHKQGTPTMGGLLFMTVFAFCTLLFGNLSNGFVWLLLLGTMAFATVGFVDDLMCIVRKNSRGLSGKIRLLIEAIITIAVTVVLLLSPEYTSELWLPVQKHWHPDIGIWYVPVAVLVVLGTANGVNLTDGLDGLATGVTLPVLAALAVFAYSAGHATIAQYLSLFFSTELGEITVLIAIFAGVLLGFLWHNSHPASMFMGDTGSLAIGGFVGLTAVMVKQELLLPIIGFVYVMETVSVILQVGSFKLRGKRIFRMAPIHHHFELQGWAENKVIVRFWMIGIVAAVVGLALLKVR